MVCFPPCKINLGLKVIGKRDDGYHDIESCFYPLPWNDILEIIPSKTMSFTNTGILVPGQHDENLCLKAFWLLQEEYDLQPVDIHLHKIVPMGAGLGGGSSDAAHALILLNEIFNLKLSITQLENFASKLGSDCAYFTHAKPMIGTGRGEILNQVELSLKGNFIVVVKPDVHVATSEAYKGIKPDGSGPSIADTLLNNSVSSWRNVLANDFETSVFRQFPMIEKAKKDLYSLGADYASMSGSGSAVFGIFNSKVDLRNHFENMIYWSGNLLV